MNVIKTLRNNWKKTVFLIGVSGFGINYGLNKYRESLLLKAYCLEAKKYGEVHFKDGDKRRRVTVFLNPAANRGNGKAMYEKNVAPLLHLAGLEVTLVKTEYEGQAKKYMEVLNETDAILVAGGNGTLSEVVTGLLRRKDEATFSQIPIGVIPLGKTNSLAQSLCPSSSSPVQVMAEMTMSAIKMMTKPVDVIHVLGEEEKSVFAVAGLQWGAFTDSEMAKTKYWYFGPLKHRLAYVVTALKYWPPINEAHLSFVLPCDGCNRCYVAPVKPQWKWWHLFLPPQVQVPTVDYSEVVNDECGVVHTEELSLSQFSVSTNNHLIQSNSPQEPKSIRITVTDGNMSKSDFIKKGWERMAETKNTETKNMKEQSMHDRDFPVKEFSLTPVGVTDKGRGSWFLLDNEQYELMNITGRLLSNKLRFFFTDSFTVPLESVQQRIL